MLTMSCPYTSRSLHKVSSQLRYWTRLDRVISLGHIGSRFRAIASRSLLLFVASGCALKGWDLALTVSNVDPLPAEKTCIHRPGAWPEQSKGDALYCEQGIYPSIAIVRHDSPDLNNGYECPCRGCPKANREKQSSNGKGE